MSGRPTKITPEVVSILADCLRQGMTIREACLQAVISHDTYYNRLKNDVQFADIMDRAQMQPTITARKVLVNQINKGDVSVAKWWLERKEPREFSLRREFEVQAEQEEAPNPFTLMTNEELYSVAEELLEYRDRLAAYSEEDEELITPVV